MTAYWFSSADVVDEDALAEYAKLARPAILGHGGRYLARGGRHVTLEGRERQRHVIPRVRFARGGPGLLRLSRVPGGPGIREKSRGARRGHRRGGVAIFFTALSERMAWARGSDPPPAAR